MILIFVSVPYTVFAQEYLLCTQSPVSSCVFSPDGRFFAAAWENQVAFWDTDSCSVIDVCTDYPGDVISIKFSQDSRNLLVICDGGIICVNSIDNFELSTLLKTDPDKNILDADFDSDYSVLIPSGGKNLNSYFLLSFLLRYTSQVIQKKLGGHNGTVFRIETAKQSEKPVAVSTSLDGQALVWDLSSYSLINEFHCNVENALPAVISPDGTKIFYAADEENLIVSGIDGSNPLTIQETGAVQTASFSGDGALIAFAVKDGGIKVYDTVSGNIAAEIPFLCNNGEKETEDQISSINSIAFNPAGKNILVGCENGCLFLWDIDDNSGHKQTFLAAGTGSGKQSGNLPPQDGLQVADGENSAGSGRNSAVPGTGRSGGTGNGAGEQSIGTGSTTAGTGAGTGQSGTGNGDGEQSSGTGGSAGEQGAGHGGTGSTAAEQGTGQSGTGNGAGEQSTGTGGSTGGQGAGQNSTGNQDAEAGAGTGQSGTGNGDGEQSTGTGESAGEQGAGHGGTGSTAAEQGTGQSGTGNQDAEAGAGTDATENQGQQKNNSAHHVTVSAGIGSIDTDLYRFTLHLNAGYFYSVSSRFFFGGTLSLRDSLPAGDFPYKYETPTEYLNPPSVYSVALCACGGLEFYPKDFIRVFVQADVGANMRFLWNTSVSSSVAGTPRFGTVMSLFAGAEFFGVRVGGGIEYDTNFGFSGYTSAGYTFRFGTEKK